MGEAGGEIARTRTDLERDLAFLQLHRLQHLAFDHRPQHALAESQRDLHLGKRQRPVGFRHELLATHRHQRIQHPLIEHLPGAYLLLHHVESCLLEIHTHAPYDRKMERFFDSSPFRAAAGGTTAHRAPARNTR